MEIAIADLQTLTSSVDPAGPSSQGRSSKRRRRIIDSESSDEEVKESVKRQRPMLHMSAKMQGKQRAVIDNDGSVDEAMVADPSTQAQLVADEQLAERLEEEERELLRRHAEDYSASEQLAIRLEEEERALLLQQQEVRGAGQQLAKHSNGSEEEVHNFDQNNHGASQEPVQHAIESDEELARLNEEDREFGKSIEAPVKDQRKKQVQLKSKKLRRKAVFWSNEIERLDDNLLKSIMAQYTGVKVDPKKQSRDDRFKVVKNHCEERESELDVPVPEFNIVRFLRKIDQLPANLAKEDIPIFIQATELDADQRASGARLLPYRDQYPKQVWQRIEALRIDRWTALARQLFLPHRDAKKWKGYFKEKNLKEETTLPPARYDFSEHESDWMSDNEVVTVSGKKAIPLPWSIIQEMKDWILKKETEGVEVTDALFKNQYRKIMNPGTSLKDVRRLFGTMEYHQKAHDIIAKKGSRLEPTHQWRICERLIAEWRAGNEVLIESCAVGTSIADRMCVYSGIRYLLAQFDITTVSDLSSSKMTALRGTLPAGLPPYYAIFFENAGTLVECQCQLHWHRSRTVPWLFASMAGTNVRCVDCCILDDETRQYEGRKAATQCPRIDIAPRSSDKGQSSSKDRVRLYKAIGPYNLYKAAYEGEKRLLLTKQHLTQDLPSLLLVVAYMRFYIQQQKIPCMDCGKPPGPKEECQSGQDVVLHIDHQHVGADPELLNDVLLLRGSVCAECNCILRSFYDRCPNVDNVEDHYNLVQDYVAGRLPNGFSEEDQKSFRNLAQSMFPEGTQGHDENGSLVARWKSQNEFDASPCPFSGQTEGLVLDHDHDTLRLRGFLSHGINLVIDRVAKIDLETHKRCVRNLQRHKRSVRADPHTWTPFQKFAVDLVKNNRWLLLQREAIIGRKAKPTRELLEQQFNEKTAEPERLDEALLRGRKVDWPENTFGNEGL